MPNKREHPNGKHLTEEDRGFIAEALGMNMTFKDIGTALHKDPGTISREVRTNRVFKSVSNFSERPNLCVDRKTCDKDHLCSTWEWGKHCRRGCRHCALCNDLCKHFEKEVCRTLTGAPYVCNGCRKRTSCRLEKYYYKAVTAQKLYARRLSSSRQGINMSEEEWVALDNFVTPLIKKGQPVSHIYNTAPDKMPCSRSTLYRYVDSGVLSLKNIDMRRVVRYKRRKPKRGIRRKTRGLTGRMYTDFLMFTVENPNLHIWEMDIVEGKRGDEKALLTLFSRPTKLMLIFLLPDRTQGSVVFALDMLEEQCGTGLFHAVFQVILTDNGSEFMDYHGIERGFFDEIRRTWLFYCDPYSSCQKAGIEKNHEYIRYVLKKGTSFDDLSWYNVAMLASHINSVARDSLDGLCPIKAFQRDYDLPLLEHVYLVYIDPLEVNLTPELLLDR